MTDQPVKLEEGRADITPVEAFEVGGLSAQSGANPVDRTYIVSIADPDN